MRRSMRWYWAGVTALGAFYVVELSVAWLVLGDWGTFSGILLPPVDWLFQSTRGIVGDDVSFYGIILLLATPGWIAGLLTFQYLFRPPRADMYLHCLKCGYILKGLSEPRCPECGERI